MKTTILIDTEKSYLSVSHLIRSESNPQGPVIRLRASNFKSAQTAIHALRKGIVPGVTDKDEIVLAALDTVTGLALRTRWDLKASNDAYPDLTSAALKLTQSDWGDASDRIGRLLEQANAWTDSTNIPFMVLSHESRRINETTGEKQGGPDLNNMLLGILINNSDAAWRIWRDDKKVKVGTQDYPAGTHFLRLETSDSLMTKKRVPRKYSEKLPVIIPDPNLVKVFQLLGPFSPLFWTVFGPPGSGKTTLAASMSDPDNFSESNLKAYESIVTAGV